MGSQIMLYLSPKLILEGEDQLAVKTPRKINQIKSNNLSPGQNNISVTVPPFTGNPLFHFSALNYRLTCLETIMVSKIT